MSTSASDREWLAIEITLHGACRPATLERTGAAIDRTRGAWSRAPRAG
jgi:hypothetical protein